MAMTELDSAVVKIMQDELAARQRDPRLAARDAHGHPAATQASGRSPTAVLIPLPVAA